MAFAHPRPGHGAAPAGSAGQARRAGGGRMNTYYAANLLVYAGVDIIACLALNLQFGVSGIVNFSFIVFQAVGAYTAAVLSMPPDTANGYASRSTSAASSFRSRSPGSAARSRAALLAIPVGLVVLQEAAERLPGDRAAGPVRDRQHRDHERPAVPQRRGRPRPGAAAAFATRSTPTRDTYQYFYIGLTAPCVALVWFVAARIVNSPFGRSRCGRCASTSSPPRPSARTRSRLKMTIFIVGGVIAGPVGRDPRRLHPAVGAVGLALPGDDHPVRRSHRRRPRQQRGRDPRGAARAGRFRRGDAADPDHHRRLDASAQPDPGPGMGGDRPAHHRVPLVQAGGRAAGAAACFRGSAGARGGRRMPATR